MNLMRIINAVQKRSILNNKNVTLLCYVTENQK